MKMIAVFTLSFFAILSHDASALVIESSHLSQSLDSANLVCDIDVTSLNYRDDSSFHIGYEAKATITQVHREKGLKERAGVGSQIIIQGPGGEKQGTGVQFSGVRKPFKGKSYKAFLKEVAPFRFEIVGFEYGLIPLVAERQFSRNRTDGSNGEGNGPFLFWESHYFPLPYYISAPAFVGRNDFISAIDNSFKAWRDIANSTVEFIPMGCSNSRGNENDGINNVILIESSWPFETSAIAITRNFYIAGDNAQAGMILDSDILLNGVNYAFTTTGESGKHDVSNIVTHEVGHFIGLGHEVTPVDSDATMFAVASPGELKKRTLAEDDLRGLRSAYPGVGQKINFGPSPSCVPAAKTTGCGSVHDSQNHFGFWFALIYLFALAKTPWLVRRLRKGWMG
jgi:hypothetical protein